MKKVLLIFFAVTCLQKVTAQEVSYGIKGGVNYAKFVTNFETSIDFKNKLGYEIGIFVKVKLAGKLFLQPELLYILQGSKADLNYSKLTVELPNDVYFADNESITINESTLILPLMIKCYLSDNFNIEFGPQVDYLFNEKITSDSDSPNRYEQARSLSQFHFGLDLGVGYQISKKVGVGLRYNYGFNSFNTDNQFLQNYKFRNSVFQLNFEYQIN